MCQLIGLRENYRNIPENLWFPVSIFPFLSTHWWKHQLLNSQPRSNTTSRTRPIRCKKYWDLHGIWRIKCLTDRRVQVEMGAFLILFVSFQPGCGGWRPNFSKMLIRILDDLIHRKSWRCQLVGGLEPFYTFFIFPYIGNNDPNWLILFRRVETTNQILSR